MLIDIGERLDELSSMSVTEYEYATLCHLRSMGYTKIDDIALEDLLESVRQSRKDIKVVCEEYGYES